MNAANDLLQSLRDFGWPVLAYVIFAPISTFALPSGRSREERLQRLVFVGIIIAVIEVLFFLGTEGGDAFQIAGVHPAWGLYVLALLLVAIVAGCRWAVIRARENRIAISISDDTTQSPPVNSRFRFYILGCAVWVAGLVLAIVWLSKIAKIQ